MGRTNPTYRDALPSTERRWRGHRRTLRRRDRPQFDRLFEHGRVHADAASVLNHEDPVVSLLLAALLKHERRSTELEAAVGMRSDPEPDRPARSGAE